MSDPMLKARSRFLTLQVMRFSAVIIALIGIANIAEKLMPESAPQMGYGFLAVGALHFFLSPLWLKKAWSLQDKSE